MIELLGEMKLDNFLEFLYPASNTERTEAYDKVFHLFYDVLTLSSIAPGFEVCAWVMFLIFVTLCPVFWCLPVTWFDNLFVTGNDLSPKSPFLMTQVVMRQFGLALVIFGLIILCYQYRAVVTYDPKRPLSGKKATILFFSLMHLPLILSPVYGLCSGCLLAVNIVTQSYRVFTAVFQITVPVVFLLLAVNSVMFMRTTKYSLSLRSGLFSYWEPPYDLLDYCFFWLCGAALPFRMYKHNTALIVVYSTGILWGAGLLVRRRTPVFCGLTASMSDAFLAYTFIDFSIFAFSVILIEQSVLDVVVGVIILVFMNVLLSGIYVGLQATVTGGYSSRITGTQVKVSLTERIKTPSDAVNALRTGVGLAFQAVCDRDMLLWILQGRFSTRILPDIVRLCLVLEVDMKEFKLPKVNFGPLDLVPLKFMGFQWRQYQNYVLTDDSPAVKNAAQVLRNLIQHCNQITNNLWTETDYQHFCLEEYGKELSNTTKTFKMYLTKHPQSEIIRKLWEEYAKTVVCQPTKCVWSQRRPFEHITSPSNTVYGFLNNGNEKAELRQHKFLYETPTERFLKKFTKSAILPRRIAVTLTFLFFIAVIIGSESIFVSVSSHGWEHYSNLSTLASQGLSLAADALQETDELIEMPIFSIIWQLLPNITAEEVNALRSPLVFDAPFLTTREVWFPILEGKDLSFSSYCDHIKFTLHTLAHMRSRNYGTFESRKCYLATVITAGKKIAELCRELDSDWEANTKAVERKRWLLAVIVGFVVVSGVYFLSVAYSTIKLRRMIVALRIVTMDKQMRHERGEVRPWFTWAVFAIWIAWFLCLAGLAVFSIGVNLDFNYRLRVMKSIMLRTTDIARASVNLMLLASLQILDQDWQDFYLNGSLQTVELLMQYLNELEIDYLFMDIPPYNDWVNFSMTQFRYAHLMETKMYATSNYAYLMSRYILVCHTSILISSTLSQLSEVSTILSFALNDSYWIVLAGCLVFSIVIWLYSEYVSRKQSLWYYGAGVLIRRQMDQPPQETYLIRDALTGAKTKYIERIPFAMLVRRSDGVIVMANQHVREFTSHGIEQILGQQFSEFFDRTTSRDFEIETKPFDNDLELITLKDVSQTRASAQRSEELIERMKPAALPQRDIFIYIDFRLDGENLHSSGSPALWDNLDSAAPFIRLFSSVAMYRAVIPVSSRDSALLAVCRVAKDVKTGFRVAVTEGEVTFLSLSDSGLLLVPCGEPVQRAEELVVSSPTRKIYVDSGICDAVTRETYSKIIGDVDVVTN